MGIRAKDFLIETLDFWPAFLSPDTTVYSPRRQKVRPVAVCEDGFMVSLQRDRDHFCDLMIQPREIEKKKKRKYFWKETIECEIPEEFLQYLGPILDPYAETVIVNDQPRLLYCYVPLEIVEDMIFQHGGIIGMRESDGHYIEKWRDLHSEIIHVVA